MFSQFCINKRRNHCPIDRFGNVGIGAQFARQRYNLCDYLLDSLRRLYVIGRFLEASCLCNVTASLG